MAQPPRLVWFRQDLRLADNPALAAAWSSGAPVVPVFIWDPEGEGRWPLGAASQWWLHHSLAALTAALESRGLRLIVRQGPSATVLDGLLADTGAGSVYWNRRYEPAVTARDAALKAQLQARGIEARSFNAALLHEPTAVRNRQGGPFQVFTPFWKHCLTLEKEAPVALPGGAGVGPAQWPKSDPLESLRLLPRLPWAAEFTLQATPGEAGAQAALRRFLKDAVARYGAERDFPAKDAVSRLSPHLHFGEIGPRQIWAACAALSKESGVFPLNAGVQKFLAEVGWREFSHHLLFHFPHTPDRPLRTEFERFPWAVDPQGRLLTAWQKGQTGYPIVDAGMRELWRTGFMHNRVRMVTASFLVKHLRLSWTLGAAWFWDTLVDADLASNTLGWQWTAGCGADAAPYFRVFAPVLQGEKFDPDGAYVRRWVPELARLPDAWLHKPWEAPASVLAAARVTLGRDYPRPLVDHKAARDAALSAFQTLGKAPGPAQASLSL